MSNDDRYLEDNAYTDGEEIWRRIEREGIGRGIWRGSTGEWEIFYYPDIEFSALIGSESGEIMVARERGERGDWVRGDSILEALREWCISRSRE